MRVAPMRIASTAFRGIRKAQQASRSRLTSFGVVRRGTTRSSPSIRHSDHPHSKFSLDGDGAVAEHTGQSTPLRSHETASRNPLRNKVHRSRKHCTVVGMGSRSISGLASGWWFDHGRVCAVSASLHRPAQSDDSPHRPGHTFPQYRLDAGSCQSRSAVRAAPTASNRDHPAGIAADDCVGDRGWC